VDRDEPAPLAVSELPQAPGAQDGVAVVPGGVPTGAQRSGQLPPSPAWQLPQDQPPPRRPHRSPPPASDEPDWYAVLGVLHTAAQEEVAIAYRRRAAAAFGRSLGGARATRNLKLLNAAYEVLGQPDRRRDYDQRRAEWLASHDLDDYPILNQKRRKRLGPAPMDRPRLFVARRGEGAAGAMLILVVVGALGLAALVLSSAIRGFSPFTSLAAQFNLVNSHQEVVAERDADLQPLGTAGPLRFATPTPPSVAAAETTAAGSGGESFAGSEATISDPQPEIGSSVTVRLRLVRDGAPLAGVPVYAVAHYRTIPNDRWPSGTRTVDTDADGMAEITQNVGNATRGYQVKVDVIATIDGEQKSWTTSFTPQ
jgi:hypothetical protein